MDPSPRHDPPILHLSAFYLSFYVYSAFFFFLLFSGILKQGPTWTDVINESGFC
jgi:hypothetical protein